MQCDNCRKLIESTYDSDTGYTEPAHCGAVTPYFWAKNEEFAIAFELTAFAYAETYNCPYHDPVDVVGEGEMLEMALMLNEAPQVEIVYADDYPYEQSDFAYDADRENRVFSR